MNDQIESKMINIRVAQKVKGWLRNRATITCVSRLDFDHFKSQLDSPSFNQRFPGYFTPNSQKINEIIDYLGDADTGQYRATYVWFKTSRKDDFGLNL